MREIPLSSLRRGDWIVFRRGKLQICHRVLEINYVGVPSVYVKGDSNAFPDGWIEWTDVLGRVQLSSLPLARRPMVYLVGAVVRLQYCIFRVLFAGPMGRWAGRLRAHWTSEPIFSQLFFRLTAPWAWFRPRRQWRRSQ